jgi:hypothetical protein
MTDPTLPPSVAAAAQAAAQAVAQAPAASNAVVQAKGPGFVAFIKKYWYVGVLVLVALVLGSLTAKGIL